MNRHSSDGVASRVVIAVAIIVVLLIAGIAAIRHWGQKHGHGNPALAMGVTSRSSAGAMPAGDTDWIGFHGGGALVGDASGLRAPPMHVRWVLHTDELQPPAPPVPTPPLPPTTTIGTTKPSATRPTSAPTTAQVFHSPGRFEAAAAIVGGVVYVADTAGAVRAIEVGSGRVKWTYTAEDGFETAPLVLDGRVLIGDTGGVFHAVAADSGKKIWIFDSGSSIHASANYLGAARENVVFGNDGADIFCLDAATGKQIWHQRAGDKVNGAPAVANNAALVSGCDSQLHAMKAADGVEEYSVDLGSQCPGSAAVVGDRMVFGTEGGRLVCISAKSHQQLWLFDDVEEHELIYSSPAIDDDVVVFGCRNRSIYGIDLITGKKLWSYPTRGEVDSSPVISSDRVYIGSKDKKLYVLDLKSGKELWTFTAGRGIEATPAIGNGVLIIGDTGGNLFCLE